MIADSKKRDIALVVDDSPETLRLLTDALDGASRLLCDAQRFGFAIRSVRIDVLKDELASVQMTLAVQPHADAAQICSRFARHVSVLSVETA